VRGVRNSFNEGQSRSREEYLLSHCFVARCRDGAVVIRSSRLGSGGQEKDKQRRNAERERGTIGRIKCVEEEEAEEGEEQDDVEEEVELVARGSVNGEGAGKDEDEVEGRRRRWMSNGEVR